MTSYRKHVPRIALGAAAIATGIAAIAHASAQPVHAAATSAQAQTLQLVESGGGVSFVHNSPKAKHPDQFSPGDIAIVTRNLSQGGKRVGKLRLACLFTTASSNHCTGSAALAGGTLEVAGVSNPQPTTQIAITGGTGKYAGARGSGISKDRAGSGDVADVTITLLP
jgi:hypothetical protein